MKITTFDEWSVAITNVLRLNENLILVNKYIGNRYHTVTLKNFYNTVMQHTGWQPTIMRMGDYFCANKLFYNGIDYTPQDVAYAKVLVLDYFADFAINAILAGYEFEEQPKGHIS
jgi:hypothetical protein